MYGAKGFVRTCAALSFRRRRCGIVQDLCGVPEDLLQLFLLDQGDRFISRTPPALPNFPLSPVLVRHHTCDQKRIDTYLRTVARTKIEVAAERHRRYLTVDAGFLERFFSGAIVLGEAFLDIAFRNDPALAPGRRDEKKFQLPIPESVWKGATLDSIVNEDGSGGSYLKKAEYRCFKIISGTFLNLS